jgi:hypothetical protein
MIERNRMKIEKEVVGQIQRDYLFLVGKVKIDAKYFINKIKEGSKNSKNNYSTNVVGLMTDWCYFCSDKEFIKAIYPVLDQVDKHKFIRRYELSVAWGIAEGFGGMTKEHDHTPSVISGVLYLNNHHQDLIFPDINEKVKPEEGRIVMFSSELKHSCHRNVTDKVKYAISFNFNEVFQY